MKVRKMLGHSALLCAVAVITALSLTTQAVAAPVGPALPVSSADKATVDRITKELEARFTPVEVSQTDSKIVASFHDRTTGQQYSFSQPVAKSTGVGPYYNTTWTEWQLNRSETYQLAEEAQTWAIIYLIGALAGCTPCAVAAAIEFNWAAKADTYYARGNCAAIKFWLAIREYSGGYCR